MIAERVFGRLAGLFVVSTLLLLGGCVASPHYPLAPEAASNLEQVDVYVGLEQREIKPTIEVSTAGGANFGLIGALIDASVNNSRAEGAEAMIRPVRNALLDYDFDSRIQEEIVVALQDQEWFADSPPELIKSALDESYKARLARSESDAVLFLTTDYSLSPDFSELEVAIRASMFPIVDGLDQYRDSGRKPTKNPNSTRLNDAIYRNVFKAVSRVPNAGDDEAAHIESWSIDNGKLARAALNEAAERVALMVAMDIQQVQGAVIGSEGEVDTKIDNRKARVVFEGEGMTIYRYTDGSLVSNVEVSP